jgi:hypothetical protein
MRVRGDTGTGGSQILGFQIPGNRPAVMFSAISFFFLGTKTSRCRSKCGGRNCLWSFPWLAVCCYLTGHKECKHQDFQRPGSRWIHAECGIQGGNVVCSCNFVICTVKYTHLCIRHRVQTSTLIKQGVCHIVTLPFTLKSYLLTKEELWKLKYFTIAKT